MTFSLEVLATPEDVAWASCKLREDLAVKGEIVARTGVQRIFEVVAMLNQRKTGRQLSAEKLAQQYKKHLKDMATDSEEITDHFIKECISLRGGILSQARIREQVVGVSEFQGWCGCWIGVGDAWWLSPQILVGLGIIWRGVRNHVPSGLLVG